MGLSDVAVGSKPAEPSARPDPTAALGRRGALANRQAFRARTWSTRTLLATCATSFVCGAVVWHMIGFWSFVSVIMFNPDGALPAIGMSGSKQQIAAASGTSATTPDSARSPPAKPVGPAQKAPDTIYGTHRPPASTETLADLLQCAEARKGEASASVHACPPLRRRLPYGTSASRANRQLDAREAARRLAEGWQTGVATIETGALPSRR